MSLRFIDGFDHYNAANDLPLKYTQSTPFNNLFYSIAQGTGRYGGFCLKTKAYVHFLVFPSSQTSWTVGCAFKFDNISVIPVGVVAFCNSYNPQIMIYADSSGRLNIAQGMDSPPTIINTGSPKTGTSVLVAGTWYYVEAQITMTGSNATAITVQLNGSNEINWTGSKAISPIDCIALSDWRNNTSNNSSYCWLDDIYILDGTGSANNTFLGDMRVETIYPNGAGTTTQFTPIGGGINYQNVNTPGSHDGDTSYNKSVAAGQIDLYAIGDLSSTPTNVAGLSVTTIARKDDAGTRTFSAIVRRSSVNYLSGAVNTLNSSYKVFQDIYDQDPSTSAAWVYAGINAMEAGVKLLS